jgi:hypothetical protein
MLLFFVACVDPKTEDSAVGGAGPDDTVDPDAYLAGTAPLAEVSGGECPTIDGSGNVDLVSNGKDRTVKVLVPESGGEGKPVVFAWYPLGGSASWLINTLDLHDFADSMDAIVVVPTAAGDQAFEWGFLDGGADDLALYDDMRTCLYDTYAVDLGRVSSFGFSAGAIWTTYLSLYRGDTLSTILTFSGGTEPVVTYQTPASAFPALLLFGGDIDVYAPADVHFDVTTANFAAELDADGHPVILCDHGLGHTIPPEGRDIMDAWLTAQTFGQPSPFADGDLSAFPDYCAAYVPPETPGG